jgi:molybdate transport system regulatory protein
MNQKPIVSPADTERCLDTVQLNRLEQSFRDWAGASPRRDVRRSRRRMLLIFLLIRYTGARLNEALALDPLADIDCGRRTVRFSGADAAPREIQISEALTVEIRALLADPGLKRLLETRFEVDPAFVRRKFYERAEACGFAKHLGGPEMIRKARAVELMQGKIPLAAIQKMLGSSMPHRTASRLSFSPDEIAQATRLFVEREASRKTSARNIFFGKIASIRRGDIQALVTLITIGGHTLSTVITNDSLKRLGLVTGRLIAAEVKAPWVVLHRGQKDPACSAENRFNGVVAGIARGRINTEYAVRIDDGTELCAVVAAPGARRLAIDEGDRVWAVFNAFSVVLHVD